jgi:hypothetical protein
MPGRTYRRSIWPVYPGIPQVYLLAIVGYLAALLGFRLPLQLPAHLQVILQVAVVVLVVLALRALLRARRSYLRLFRAQSLFAYAVLLQALLLLLPH